MRLKKLYQINDFRSANKYNLIILNGMWLEKSNSSCMIEEVTPCVIMSITNYRNETTSFAFLKKQTPIIGESVLFAKGSSVVDIPSGCNIEIEVPSDAEYLYVLSTNENGNNTIPEVLSYVYTN